MYTCEKCGAQSAPGQKQARIVVERRPHEHPKRLHLDDPGGVGTQIVREIVAHPECAAGDAATMAAAFEAVA